MLKIIIVSVLLVYFIGIFISFFINAFDRWAPLKRHDIWASLIVNIIASISWPFVLWNNFHHCFEDDRKEE